MSFTTSKVSGYCAALIFQIASHILSDNRKQRSGNLISECLSDNPTNKGIQTYVVNELEIDVVYQRRKYLGKYNIIFVQTYLNGH